MRDIPLDRRRCRFLRHERALGHALKKRLMIHYFQTRWQESDLRKTRTQIPSLAPEKSPSPGPRKTNLVEGTPRNERRSPIFGGFAKSRPAFWPRSPAGPHAPPFPATFFFTSANGEKRLKSIPFEAAGDLEESGVFLKFSAAVQTAAGWGSPVPN